jgi:hypothetical protein
LDRDDADREAQAVLDAAALEVFKGVGYVGS